MNSIAPELSPAVESQEIPLAFRPRTRRRRWRISVAGLMLLIGLIAVGLAVVDRWWSIRFVVWNDRNRAIHNVRVEHGGEQFATDLIGPSEYREWRIPMRLTGPFRLSYEAANPATNAVERIQTSTSINIRPGETLYVRVVPNGHMFGTAPR